MKKLIIGNWKMNLTRAEARELAATLKNKGESKGELVICPPFVWLTDIADILRNGDVLLGAQDAHAAEKGAFTGDISAPMLQDIGVSHVILGHSERRQHHQETSAQVRAKAEMAIQYGLVPVICVGELAAERETGRQEQVVGSQLAESLPKSGVYIVAYEPVWAIGTGKTATVEDIHAMHAFIRKALPNPVDQAAQVAILYGGSVKAANASEIMAIEHVDGVLVGGASLQAEEFWAIAQS